jgi:beta-N-acetylhexosaminidase
MSRTASNNLSAQIGQLLVVGFDGTEISPRLASLLSKIQPAGVILFGRNITGAEQTHRLLRECQRCVRTPLFTCVDLEGGQVDRFRNLLGPAPSADDVFATGDRKLFRKHGRVIGENCRALGFNVDFAPVLDLAFEASRMVMSSRAVSADPREVVGYVREFLLGLRESGVLGCGKHFPGLGEGKLDSHDELPVIQKSLKKMWVEDLIPYRTLRRQLPFVMVSHAAYPEVTGDAAPASLSKKWITDILRRRIGYNGIIASDDMEMGAVQKFALIEESVVQHVRAGGDLALICHSEELITRGYEALVRAAEADGRFRAQVTESAARVLKIKKSLGALARFRRSPLPTVHKVERLSRELWEFGEEVRLAALDRPQVIPQKTRADLRHGAQRHSAQRKTGPNEAERP